MMAGAFECPVCNGACTAGFPDANGAGGRPDLALLQWLARWGSAGWVQVR